MTKAKDLPRLQFQPSEEMRDVLLVLTKELQRQGRTLMDFVMEAVVEKAQREQLVEKIPKGPKTKQ